MALLGPAFVAAVAYVDPGNFATNFSAGAQFGYALAWVVVAANLMAMLVQYLSAKTGVATGARPAASCAASTSAAAVSAGLWVQAELIAMATDLAEFVGAALGLNLLFRVPLLAAGLITAVVAFAILALEQRGYRRFELAIAGAARHRLPRLRLRPGRASGPARAASPPGWSRAWPATSCCWCRASSGRRSCRTWSTCTPR